MVTLTLALCLASDPETWLQWRGPTRDGLVSSSVTWPDKLSGLTQRYRVELGPSYSGPIVTSDKVFITETLNKKTETVKALDRKSGKVLWTREWEGAMTVPFFAKANGDWIRSTPACDGQSLYVAGMRDVLVCLDVNTGSERWRLDFMKETGSKLPDFGFVCSPLVVGEHVYVQAGGAFCKVDKATGKLVWKTLEDGGGMYGSAFSSPVFAKLLGKDLLVVQTRTKLAGVDPADGKVLWQEEVPAFRGMNILTPSIVGDAIFTSSHSGGTFLYGIKPDHAGVQQTWKQRFDGYMSSPIIIDGHVYLHLKNQRFCCVELKTGTSKWTTPKAFGKYWSMVAQKDRILALDENGELLLIHATPEKFDLLDRKKVSTSEAWAHVAVVGDEVYVRDLQGLSVYQWK
jgi:outer membrane protein assembly factor BamB